MNLFGNFIEPGTIQFERLLPGPIERIWACLTESEKRKEWLAAGSMELLKGGKVALHFNHRELSPYKEPTPEKYKEYEGEVILRGVVTEIDPPRLLRFTWGGDGEVTFELTPKSDKVHLLLTHTRLGDDQATLLSVSSGWHTHLGILKDRLNGYSPEGFWTVHERVEVEYNKIIAAQKGP